MPQNPSEPPVPVPNLTVEDRIQILETKQTARWQRAQLPLMRGMLVLLTLFFCLASATFIFLLQDRLEHWEPESEITITDYFPHDTPTQQGAIPNAQFLAFYQLEQQALERRYIRANTLLLSRIWIKFLGFLTGIILAVVGAVFILGKLREGPSTLASENQVTGKLSLTSSSPGLFLTLFGTTLMLTTILNHNEITVEDGRLFLPTVDLTSPSAFEEGPRGTDPHPGATGHRPFAGFSLEEASEEKAAQ
ncbi:MAG: hypothetical protein AAGN35_22360 [Bacteroidota bacterium]